MKLATLGAAAIAACCISAAAYAKEYPIGKAQEQEGMRISAVYLQPIEMDPPGMMRDAKEFRHPSRSRHQGGAL